MINPIIKKTLKFFLNLVLYLVIFFGVLWGAPKALSHWLNTPYPMAAITSGSMWPALKEGNLVFIQGIDRSQLAIGDVVVWRNESGAGFVIHRVVKLNDDTFVTKGDANFTEDPPVNYRQLVGRALTWRNTIVRLPYLGSITTFASKNLTSTR
ncbi:MAG: signal peptidase I [Patescibacteria group bacterium]